MRGIGPQRFRPRALAITRASRDEGGGDPSMGATGESHRSARSTPCRRPFRLLIMKAASSIDSTLFGPR
jgi:hypothetical protein